MSLYAFIHRRIHRIPPQKFGQGGPGGSVSELTTLRLL